MAQAKIGIIGGSGLYRMETLKDVEEVQVDTPFGSPSDALLLGTLEGTRVAFLARHGRTHHLLPSELPFRANIHAMKQLGVEYLISASAVGSLKEEVKPLDMVVPDQFIDRTKNRVSTFFGEGIVAHIAFADPICPQLGKIVVDAVASLELPDVTLHQGGTYVCMEGLCILYEGGIAFVPQLGGDDHWDDQFAGGEVSEEAEIAYATLALVTDYDCWHPDHDSVTVEMVIGNLQRNAVNAQKVIQETVRRVSENPFVSEAHSALKYAILTQLDKVPAATKEKLQLLLKKYL